MPSEDFDVERQDLLDRISCCQASAAESHSLRCEVQKRSEEVRELQQALSTAHMHLFEERDRLLQLQAENDELRLHDMESQQRIQHLTALIDPINQAVTFNRDQDPLSDVVYPQKKGKAVGRGAFLELSVFYMLEACCGRSRIQAFKSYEMNLLSGRLASQPDAEVDQSQRILRTVFLPAANSDALRLKVESLQAQLAEQKQLSFERVEALKQDRQLREQVDPSALCAVVG